MTFKLNQDILVNGKPASFIGYMRDGREAQVCLTDRKYKPNVIVALGEIAPVVFGSKSKTKPAPVSLVADTATE